MGLRFRKSVKAGPMRINFSKSGVGYSVGTKGFRYTKKANGGTRTTTSIPGTGISYVKDSRKESTAASQSSGAAVIGGDGSQTPAQHEKPITGTELALAWLLGCLGAHKFYRKKYGMGVLYLLTLGLFLFGWIGDAVCLTFRYINQRNGRETTKKGRVASYIASIVCVVIFLGSCGAGGNTADQPEPTTVPAVTETTETATTEATVPETTEPETTVPETTVSETTVPETTVPDTTVPVATVPEQTEMMVWIPTNGGTKYHRKSSCSNMENPEHVPISQAIEMGFTACKRCG